MVKKIVIVGGGSAGWLTAGILAAEHGESLSICLVESPDVNTIGVGEGTWPTMRTTLQRMGISEATFIQECHASFKQGSKFVQWTSGTSDDVYYHPFTLPQGSSSAKLFTAWQKHFDNVPFSEAVCMQTRICDEGLAPKTISVPEYAGVQNYGYHLDAGKFVGLLKRHCVENLSVEHICDHVTGVHSNHCGDIESVETVNSGFLQGDLFIDCSGFSSLLIDQHYAIPFVDQKMYSINDRAIAIQVPYLESQDGIASATIATAQSAGWTWDIGLSSRRGVGYVYSSNHISEESAEQELRSYIGKSIGITEANKLSAKKIKIRAGHREKFWHRNCVAIGMAAGFIEPLEASALALIELSANMIRDELPMTRDTMGIVSKKFNKTFRYRWVRIIEFLKLHYVLSQRKDTPYWRDVSDQKTIPKGLAELLLLWQRRAPNFRDLLHVEEIFPVASYEYVLYGMGFYPNLSNTAQNSLDSAFTEIEENFKKTKNYLSSLPSNRDLIENIKQYGLQKV